jgi:hypothetical protein
LHNRIYLEFENSLVGVAAGILHNGAKAHPMPLIASLGSSPMLKWRSHEEMMNLPNTMAYIGHAFFPSLYVVSLVAGFFDQFLSLQKQ